MQRERDLTETSVIVAGFGGQGVLFLGRLVAYGGMLENREATWFPSYGAEMRGGTANCTTIISDSMIGSPIVRHADIVIAMNEASLKRFQPAVKEGGLLIFDSSFVRFPDLRSDVRSIAVPASGIAASLADSQIKPANMIMLGVLIAAAGLIKEESALKALEILMTSKRKKSIECNKQAIRKGIGCIEDKKSRDI